MLGGIISSSGIGVIIPSLAVLSGSPLYLKENEKEFDCM